MEVFAEQFGQLVESRFTIAVETTSGIFEGATILLTLAVGTDQSQRSPQCDFEELCYRFAKAASEVQGSYFPRLPKGADTMIGTWIRRIGD
jgi:hypothetical protein